MREVGRGTVKLAMGITLIRGLNYPFDYILYPIVMLWLGNLTGGLLMVALSLLLNTAIIGLYDWSKVDWLLLEKVKHLQHQDVGQGWLVRALRLVSRNKALTFFVLCLDDPVTVTLYFREGSYRFNGLNSRDWRIFLAATVVSNMYWIAGWAGVIELGRWVFSGINA